VEDDHTLWQRWRTGDRAAAHELYVRHCATVSRVFTAKLQLSVDDMVQRTFLKAAETASKDAEIRSVRAYLVATARNLLLDAFREGAGPRGRIDPLTQTLDGLEASMSGVVARVQERNALFVALRRIPVDAQLLLELFSWEGMTGDELAETFAVPVGTIRSRLRRARDALRRHMSTVSPEEIAELSRRPDFSGWAAALRDGSEDDV
jgi:RNA polymerase sigma-70 factor (ECF subfamily)